MKPIAADKLNGTGEALAFIDSRADLLHSLCRSTQDTTQTAGGDESDRQTLNRVFELLLIMQDEIEYLKEEIATAMDIEANESAAPAAADPGKGGAR